MPRFRMDEERENIFSLYQAVHAEGLSKIVGARVFELEQEVPLGGKKVDICGWAEDLKQNIYVEVQLKPADNKHMETVKQIISNIDQGIVIWEALSFVRREHLVKEVEEHARWLKKPIDVFFIKINPDVIPVLGQLTLLHPLEIVPNLNRLSEVREPFEMIAECRGRNLLAGEQDDGLVAVNDSRQQGILGPVTLSTRLGANQYILMQIRKKMSYYPGAYRAKSRLNTNAITFGVGNGNLFEISIRDAFSHVKLRIPNKNTNTWVQLRMDKIMIEHRIGHRINFKEGRTSYIVDAPVKSFGLMRTEVLDEAVEIFKRFVDFFTEYLYLKVDDKKVAGLGDSL